MRARAVGASSGAGLWPFLVPSQLAAIRQGAVLGPLLFGIGFGADSSIFFVKGRSGDLSNASDRHPLPPVRLSFSS